MSASDLRDNLFVVQVKPGKYIVYAPLQGYSFFCGENDAEELKQYINCGQMPQNVRLSSYISELLFKPKEAPYKSPDINYLDKLLIILSQRCNLCCSYCFAQSSRSTDILDMNSLKAAIEYLLAQNTDNQKTFTFIGGGEPLVTWDLLKKSIKYIELRAKGLKIKYQIRIVTNATLLDEDKLKWLNRDNIVISVSSDILPDIQNIQRPFYNHDRNSFDYIDKAIKLLHEYKIPHTLRATITEINVERMDEMADFAIRYYRHINRLHFEPVTDNTIDNKAFFDKYVKYFISTYDRCAKKGVYLTNSYITSFEHIKVHLCQGEMCLTPNGSLVACHRHSSGNDPLYEKFKYGNVQDGQIIINESQLNNIIDMRNSRFDECSFCIAKWHCAGGCTSKRQVYNEVNQVLHCEFTRNLITRYIEYKLTH